ncbi:MAG: GntR family transcriptional regulator [Alphaproteobacteria bacterium]|nr:MAG: GntR family transcriptional regulator [Alphaproteobacteria bacterium]
MDDQSRIPEPPTRAAPTRERSAESLSEVAYRKIEEMIVTLKLEPGTVLSEAALSERLGIGRTPVREALQRLAIEGLVVILPRRGVIVSEINLSRHLGLLEVRRELERLIARRAARRATAEERAAFRQLAEDFTHCAATNDDIAFMRHDKAFNAMTLAACRNEYAARAMMLMQGLSRRFWYQHYRETLDLPRCARLHADVARAIAEGDETAAARASDALIDYIEAFARATI